MSPVKELHIPNWNGNEAKVRYLSGFMLCLSSCVQGKGLMKTYWVSGRKSAKKVSEFEEESPEILNPFQMSRQDPDCFLGPGPMCSQNLLVITPPTTRKRPISPKPDEWPEADRRLSESVEQRRSSTVPPSTGGTEPMMVRSRYSSICDTLPQSRNSLVGDGPLMFPARSMSEFNILQIRNSICEALPAVPEMSSPQLAVFAALADDNARRARRLADWAAELARTVREEGEEGGPGVHPEGTSVDLHYPSETVSTTQEESEVERNTSGSGSGNTCSIM